MQVCMVQGAWCRGVHAMTHLAMPRGRRVTPRLATAHSRQDAMRCEVMLCNVMCSAFQRVTQSSNPSTAPHCSALRNGMALCRVPSPHTGLPTLLDYTQPYPPDTTPHHTASHHTAPHRTTPPTKHSSYRPSCHRRLVFLCRQLTRKLSRFDTQTRGRFGTTSEPWVTRKRHSSGRRPICRLSWR